MGQTERQAYLKAVLGQPEMYSTKVIVPAVVPTLQAVRDFFNKALQGGSRLAGRDCTKFTPPAHYSHMGMAGGFYPPLAAAAWDGAPKFLSFKGLSEENPGVSDFGYRLFPDYSTETYHFCDE